MAKERLTVEQSGDVTIIKFLDKRILNEQIIQAIADQLSGLVEAGNHRLLLNFSGVEYMSSAVLGKLINLHKRVTGMEGALALCKVVPQIQEVFAITKLDKLFKIYPDETAATAAM